MLKQWGLFEACRCCKDELRAVARSEERPQGARGRDVGKVRTSALADVTTREGQVQDPGLVWLAYALKLVAGKLVKKATVNAADALAS